MRQGYKVSSVFHLPRRERVTQVINAKTGDMRQPLKHGTMMVIDVPPRLREKDTILGFRDPFGKNFGSSI